MSSSPKLNLTPLELKDDQIVGISGVYNPVIYDPFTPHDPNNIPDWMQPAHVPTCPPGQIWNPSLHRCAIVGSKDDPTKEQQVKTYKIPLDPPVWIKVDQYYWKNYENWLLNIISAIKDIYGKDVTYSVKLVSTGPFPDVSTKLNFYGVYALTYGGAIYPAGPGLYVRANGNYSKAALLIGRVFSFKEIVKIQE